MGKPMMYVGIDPGKKGGICFLNGQGIVEHISPMPTEKTLSGLLSSGRHLIAHVCLEKAQSYTGQGIASTFNYGVGYGIIQGLLIAHQVPFSLVPPRTWQKTMIVPTRLKDPKAKALASANKVFKKNKTFWLPSSRHRVPHDGMIDSALLAEYCRRIKKNDG